MALILIWGIIGVFVILQSSRFSGFSRLFHTDTDASRKEPIGSPEAPGKKIRLVIPEKLLVPYRQAIAALSRSTRKSLLLFTGIAGLAIGTGVLVLFVEMPLFLLAVLSVFSLATLVPVVISARIRFFPSALPDMQDTAPPVPEKKIPERFSPKPVIEPVVPDETEQHDTKKTEHGLLTRYEVTPPYSSVKIVRQGNAGFTYNIIEPPLSAREKTILRETYTYLRDVIIYDDTENNLDKHLNPSVIYPVFCQFDPVLSEERLAILYYYLKRDLSGYGPLDVLMKDPAIEDMSCNGKDLPVFIFHRVYGSLPTSVVFSEGELNQFVLKIAQKANKQVSLSNPMVDATLPDGSRIQITYSDVVSTKGSSFTIRKFREEPMTPLDLISLKTYDAEILAFLWLAIEHHKSMIIAGGTASGKTSTMNAVSLFIPQNAKIVSLEDTREIQLPHKNWLPTQTRELIASGVKGDDIDLFSLLKACMRQRPEYIIVGEVRGHEAQTLFQAMNTGHATLSTIHAGSVQEAINRLTHDPINVSPVMFSALDLFVIQSLYSFGNTRIRRCVSIHEIDVNSNGEILSTPLYEWDMESDTFKKVAQHSRVLADIATHRGWSLEEVQRQLQKREEFFTWALEVRPPDIRDLANAIHNMSD
ncbi:type II/IV secretion system ATPase subunit [Methanoregula sp.]|uniref:type II/IV secretion system ATPase subunit n=1 Tax=Methanoregula sp. TaxID=2052170 RepID=UPI00356A6BB1